MRSIYQGFFINRFGIGPLHYILSRSDFGFKFAEIFVIEKRLPNSAIKSLKENSPHWCVGEWSIPRIAESESWRLPDLASRGVAMVSRGSRY
jgi:hypothetical protein